MKEAIGRLVATGRRWRRFRAWWNDSTGVGRLQDDGDEETRLRCLWEGFRAGATYERLRERERERFAKAKPDERRWRYQRTEADVDL